MPFSKSFSGKIEENYHGPFATVEEAELYEWELPNVLQRMVYEQDTENVISLHSEDRTHIMKKVFPQVPIEKRDTFLAVYNKNSYLFDGFPLDWDNDAWMLILLSTPILESYNELKDISPNLFNIKINVGHYVIQSSFWDIYFKSEDPDSRLFEVSKNRFFGGSIKNCSKEILKYHANQLSQTIIEMEDVTTFKAGFLYNIFGLVDMMLDTDNIILKQKIIDIMFINYLPVYNIFILKIAVDKCGILPRFVTFSKIQHVQFNFSSSVIAAKLILNIIIQERRIIKEYIESHPAEEKDYDGCEVVMNEFLVNYINSLKRSHVNGDILKVLREMYPNLVNISLFMKNAKDAYNPNVLSYCEEVPQTKIRLKIDEQKFLIAYFVDDIPVNKFFYYDAFIQYLHPLDGLYFKRLLRKINEDKKALIAQLIKQDLYVVPVIQVQIRDPNFALAQDNVPIWIFVEEAKARVDNGEILCTFSPARGENKGKICGCNVRLVSTNHGNRCFRHVHHIGTINANLQFI